MSLYPKGPKGKADRLFSQLIRSRGACEGCGSTQNLQTAHIISRRYNEVRHDTDNAFCACAKCHLRWTEWPMEFAEFVFQKIGPDGYMVLQSKAMAEPRTWKDSDWTAVCERLSALLEAAA